MSNKKQEKRENINVLECMAAKLPQIASHQRYAAARSGCCRCSRREDHGGCRRYPL